MSVAVNASYFSGYSVAQFASAACGKVQEVLVNGLSDMEVMIKHAKVMDAFIGVQKEFFSVEPGVTEGAFQASLKQFKGWNALMTISRSVKETAEKVASFFKERTYRLAIDSIGMLAGIVSKAYDVASFLENQIAVPAMKGVSDAWKNTSFQALLVGSFARGTLAGEKVLSSIRGEAGFNDGVKNTLKVLDSVGGATLSAAILTGQSAQLTAVASAVSAASKLSEYYWSNVFTK